MQAKLLDRQANLERRDVQVIARKALANLLRPLAGFVLDTGLSAIELQRMWRIAAVRNAADRQREANVRVSISGIAATTGISRAEISQILRMSDRQAVTNRERQSTNRILSAWHEDPKYTNANGDPADLKIFGSGVTFDSLVRTHGRGIPTRALLDELARTGSVKVLSSKKVRVRALVAVDRGVGPRAVKVFGDRATELLTIMLSNMRFPEKYRFVSSVEAMIGSPELLPIFRKEVSNKGGDFLAGIRESLFREPFGKGHKPKSKNATKVAVTIYYGEAANQTNTGKKPSKKRRNLRRGS